MKNKQLINTLPFNIIHAFARTFIWTEHERKANELSKIISKRSEKEQFEHCIRVAEKLQKIYGKDVDFDFIEGKLAARKNNAFPKFEVLIHWVLTNLRYSFFNKRSK